MKLFNFWITESLHKKFKLKSVNKKMSMSKIVRKLIEDWVK